MKNTTISQRGERYTFDILVMGSGIAGLSYVLELLKLHSNVRVALLTKKQLGESNTRYAQGGIAAAKDSLEGLSRHTADTLSAGDGLCDSEIALAILQKGPESIQYLIDQGVEFDRANEGTLDCGREGGHSESRIYHCGDQTGAAISEALIQQLKKNSQVSIFEYHTAVNLIKVGTEIIGAYVLDEVRGLIHSFIAQATVLATGGAGKVYRYTSNPEVATGDGVAMAYRAGAPVEGMEFYQFHPTLLYHPEFNNFLISEALRGEGAHLRLVDTGERFMERYAPEAMELATRDVVARAIFTEIEKSEYSYVHLDIRHKDKSFLMHRFPMIYETLLKLGLDLSRDLIPVVPAAHYMCGGIVTDVSGRTGLKRLFAIGETAFTGFHGANRLASNSLLEGLVMGRNAAAASSEWINAPVTLQGNIHDWDSASVVNIRRASQIHVHWRGLRGEMNSYAGIIRTEEGLRDQLKLISVRRDMIEEYYWKHKVTRDLIELRNIALIAELIVRAALSRRESRGGHYREDYPEKIV
ncbi:MAG: L-aspartate oxidase [Proteobacteria bacterium]|nr:L-aspartate oxidase [Pseudomonadota bacterium]